MPKVIIYRHQLFLPSEPFIAQQAQALRRFQPVYAGRTMRQNDEAKYPTVTLTDQGWLGVARHALFKDVHTLAERCRDHHPALVHAHFGVEGVYALPLAIRLKVPLVTTFHGFDVTTRTSRLFTSGKVSWINYALARRRLARQGSLFICVSDFIRRQALQLGFPAEHTITNYIGIDLERDLPVRPPAERPYILHVARLVEVKGTRDLIAAFSTFAARVPELELIIVGDGPLREDLQQQAESDGFATRIHFLGARPHQEVLQYMAGASVFCLPSVTARYGEAEGLGMVLLEAAAMQVPTVGTYNGGIPEVISDGETGFLVPERDPAALAARLEQLVTDPSMRTGMGRAARRVIEERFDIRRQTARLESLYDTVLH